MHKDVNAGLGTEGVVWSLQDLYSGPEAAELENDFARCRRMAEHFSAKHVGRVAMLTSEELAETVRQLEEIEELLARLATYGFLYFTTRTDDALASALLQRTEELSAQVGKLTVFFRLEWNRLDRRQVETLLAVPVLDSYRHYLETLRRFSPHQLSQKEEELLQELAPIGRSAWNLLFDKLFGQLQFGTAKRTEEEVLSDLYHADREVRRQAAGDLTRGLEDNLHILSHIFNTLAAEKMISDRVRSYGSWVSRRNLDNELQDATVAVLIDTVTNRYDIVHRYYRVKRQMLGLEELKDYDRYAPVPGLSQTAIPWLECKEIVLDSFDTFSPKMAAIAERFFTEHWIHAPIVRGKRGGAFAHPCVPAVHPYVMVNYTGEHRDVATVAHELGHGVHQSLAAAQGFYNSDTTQVLAETASVFAELLVFKAQLDLLDSQQARRAYTCQKLESIFATVFRQVSMNRFEHAMHTARKEQGELAAEQLSELWLKTQEPMFGSEVTLTEDYRVWWAYIPHFLESPGYVYSYAFGELLVLALYARYQQQGEGFVDTYLQLLSAGGCQSPYELLQPFGIDLNDPDFWNSGLNIIEEMVAEVEA